LPTWLRTLVVFLERLSDIGGTSLPPTHIALLDELYTLSTNPNVEIRLRFYNLVLASSSASTYLKSAADWVVDPKLIKGRMKFCRPVFRKMADVDKEFALATFRSNAQFFHPIARRLIERVRCLFV
jgi:leukotriene-A4 hydrolase